MSAIGGKLVVFGGLVRRTFKCFVTHQDRPWTSSSVTPPWAADSNHRIVSAGPYLQHLLSRADHCGSHHVQLPCSACMYALFAPGSCANAV